MALTPRILVHNPAAAAVAAVTILGLSVTGTTVLQSWSECWSSNAEDAMVYHYEIPCADVAQQLGDRDDWNELSWVVYASCFQERNDSRMTIRVAREGLDAHPASESLWNMMGYHQIVLGQYNQAESTFRHALKTLEPTDGTMENNLAWTGLWNGRVELSEMRILYASALDREPALCEALHTGLMVEYSISNRARTTFERAEALKRFQLLRDRYDVCESRVYEGTWDTMVEVAGVTVLYQQVDEAMGLAYNHETRRDLNTVGREWQTYFPEASVEALCDEAIPATLNTECERIVTKAVAAARPGTVKF